MEAKKVEIKAKKGKKPEDIQRERKIQIKNKCDLERQIIQKRIKKCVAENQFDISKMMVETEKSCQMDRIKKQIMDEFGSKYHNINALVK